MGKINANGFQLGMNLANNAFTYYDKQQAEQRLLDDREVLRQDRESLQQAAQAGRDLIADEPDYYRDDYVPDFGVQQEPPAADLPKERPAKPAETDELELDPAAHNPAQANAVEGAGGNPVQANLVAGDKENAVTNNIASSWKAGMAENRRQRQMMLNIYDQALAARDRQGMASTMAGIKSLDATAEDAQVFNHVYNNPQMAQGVADGLSRNPLLGFKAVRNKDDSWELQRNDGSDAATLDRQSLAMAAVHLRRIQRGDVKGGYDGLSGINKELADAVVKTSNLEAALVKGNNEARLRRSQTQLTDERAGFQRGAQTQLAEARAQAALAPRPAAAARGGRAAVPDPDAPPVVQAQRLLASANKDAPSDAKLSPEAYAQAETNLGSLAQLNPKASPSQLTSLAVQLARRPVRQDALPVAFDLEGGRIIYPRPDPSGLSGPMVLGTPSVDGLTAAQRKSLESQLPQLAGHMGLPGGVRTLVEATRDPERARQVVDGWMARQADTFTQERARYEQLLGRPISDERMNRHLAAKRQRAQGWIDMAGSVLQKR